MIISCILWSVVYRSVVRHAFHARHERERETSETRSERETERVRVYMREMEFSVRVTVQQSTVLVLQRKVEYG
jgi:hypothetical protein